VNVGGRSLISLNFGRDIFRFSVKRGIPRGWELLKKRATLLWQWIFRANSSAIFEKKAVSFFDTYECEHLDGHRRNKWYHSWRKTANALPRGFSLKIYRTLSLKTVLCGKCFHSVIVTLALWMFCLPTFLWSFYLTLNNTLQKR